MAAASLDRRVALLRENREHGGAWMARQAIEALLDVAHAEAASGEELLAKLTDAGRRLAASRPGVAAIAGAVGRLLAPVHGWADLSPDELRQRLDLEGKALLDVRDRAPMAIAVQLRERLDEAMVFTHSASSTVKAALVHAQPHRVLCTVSHPYDEGAGFAEELRAEGFEVDLIEDDVAPERVEDASLVLLGADTVFLDGSLLNKIGTRPLCAAAAQHHIPVVVACEVIKLAAFESSEARTDAAADLTPPDLIEFFVTEEGRFHPDEIRALADRTPFLRSGRELLAES